MAAQFQGKISDSIDVAWARLASRAVRVALTRRDVSYAQLADELTKLGLSESARSVEGKVQRGTFRFTFFLQALMASHGEYPEHWSRALSDESPWEVRAAALMKGELALHPWLDWGKLSRRLGEIGVNLPPEALATQIDDGMFSAALFFQCAAVCRFNGTQLFLDASDLNEAALVGASAA
ncbi:DUF6471 domain-containing protein [Paraburkholderia caffeinilytica]|uniref:DUF6471 domain-containing protein n=1 Tax=Paraburkholderia caffeinilytica TaxID=1761016 RepID=UPI003DA0E6C0